MTNPNNDLREILGVKPGFKSLRMEAVLAWHQKEVKASVREARKKEWERFFKLAVQASQEIEHCTDDQIIYTAPFLVAIKEQEGINPQREGRNG